MTYRLVYSIAEVATLLGISRNTAYESAHRGEIPTIQLGRRLLVPRHRLEAMLGIATDGDEGVGADG